MMSADHGDHDDHEGHEHELYDGIEICTLPVPSPSIQAAAQAAAAAAAASTVQAFFPLGAIPVLNSLPGAAASIYLDFDGHVDPTWLNFSNVVTPVFDRDGNPGTFSTAEIDEMKLVWEVVAEDYAPFNINVTTVPPPSFGDREALRVAIGGAGSWFTAVVGGVAPINAFTNGAENTVFVFTDNVAGAKNVGEASSHEVGHALGLLHQSEYDANGVKTAEYSTGPGDGRAPIMGVAYGSVRGLWWNGPNSTSSTTIQDDLSIVSGTNNGFGYRNDDHGNAFKVATKFPASKNISFRFDGILTSTVDVDYFSFVTGAGRISVSAAVPQIVNNLDVKLELRNAKGDIIAFDAPSGIFDAAITATVPAGTYVVVVASQGGYGDIGPYSLTGTIVKPNHLIKAARNLAVAPAQATRVQLNWIDAANNESGYIVERSTNNRRWIRIATLPANSTSYVDTTSGAAYYYRVRVFNNDFEATSNVATLPTPATPTKLVALGRTATHVQLKWRDNSLNESTFIVQRSSNNGRTWSTIGQVRPNLDTIIDRSVTPRRQYLYRVAAVNGDIQSAFSNTARVVTPGLKPRVSTGIAVSAGLPFGTTPQAQAADSVRVQQPDLDLTALPSGPKSPSLESAATPPVAVQCALKVASSRTASVPALTVGAVIEAARPASKAASWEALLDAAFADDAWSLRPGRNALLVG